MMLSKIIAGQNGVVRGMVRSAQVIYCQSGTFRVRRTGWYRVTVIGGGGSGAASRDQNQGVTGGAAGGFCQAWLELKKGDEWVVIVGGGGERVAVTMGTVEGKSGGNSLFRTQDNKSYVISNGGGGGKVGITASGGTVGIVGLSGIEMVWTVGGGSGTATARSATGGGSVGIKNSNGFSSGDATVVGNYYAVTGGAGVGGKSGNASADSGRPYAYSGGGGSVSWSMDNSDAGGRNILLGYRDSSNYEINEPVENDILYPRGSGGYVSTQSGLYRGFNGSSGGGGAGGISTSVNPGSNISWAGHGGSFAGGGGIISTTQYATIGGYGGVGGGGGGSVALYSGSGTYHAISGQGGTGLVVIEEFF